MIVRILHIPDDDFQALFNSGVELAVYVKGTIYITDAFDNDTTHKKLVKDYKEAKKKLSEYEFNKMNK